MCGRDWSSDVCSSDLARGGSVVVVSLDGRNDNQSVVAERDVQPKVVQFQIGRASCRERV